VKENVRPRVRIENCDATDRGEVLGGIEDHKKRADLDTGKRGEEIVRVSKKENPP